MVDSQQGASTGTAVQTRSATPESDPIESAPKQNPFTSPYTSMPPSALASTTGFQTPGEQQEQPRYFHSRRIKKGEIERPWLERKDPKEKWVTIIPLVGLAVGIGLAAFLIYEGLTTVSNHVYCPVFMDDFSNGLDESVWTKEVEVGGFGNGQFEETTNTDENAYVQDGTLFIKPTLQDASLVETNNILNLTKTSTCTSNLWSNCVAVTNTTNGTIINPVKSARLNTKKAANIRFGRIEVEAKLPEGDWLWPAIWMLPKSSLYGPWPASGEIDIMESRGNNYTYPQGGNNIISSTLHWGPDTTDDAWWQNNVKQKALHTTYSAGYNTFGLEWSEKYIFTFINTRLLQVMYVNFNKPFWTKGDFPPSNENGTRLVNPWGQTGRDSTPFDQDFYLILNVAVGGTNGWFDDGVANKPWVDESPSAKLNFWQARDQWYPTWQKGGWMEVKSVKMWQQKGYNGC